MRIAFLVDAFPVFSETFILDQITGLLDRGHDVRIMANCRTDEKNLHPHVVKYDLLSRCYFWGEKPENLFLRVFYAFPYLLKNIFRLRGALSIFYAVNAFRKAGEFDIAVCHFGWNGLVAVRLKKAGCLNAKIVTVFHGSDMSKYPRIMGEDVYSDLFTSGDLFLPVSDRWKERLIRLGCTPARIKVHRMGVDVAAIGPGKSRPAGDGVVTVLSAARLVKKKGIESGIGAFGKAVKERPDIAMKYRIAGEGPLMGGLKAIADETCEGGSVEFLGRKYRDEVISLMKSSDIFMAPSVTDPAGDQEGIPVALMEAMAAGCTVLSTQHSGIPELIESGKNGLLVPEGDVGRLAEALSMLVDDAGMRKGLADAARKTVENEYDIRKLNDELERTLKGLIGDAE